MYADLKSLLPLVSYGEHYRYYSGHMTIQRKYWSKTLYSVTIFVYRHMIITSCLVHSWNSTTRIHWWGSTQCKHTIKRSTIMVCISYMLGRKLPQNFISIRYRPDKSTETRQRRKNTRRLPTSAKIHSRCRVVFMCSFICLAFCKFFHVHSYLKRSFAEFFPQFLNPFLGFLNQLLHGTRFEVLSITHLQIWHHSHYRWTSLLLATRKSSIKPLLLKKLPVNPKN